MEIAKLFIILIKFWAVIAQENLVDLATRRRLLLEDMLYHVVTNKSSGFETKGAEVICLQGNMCIAISSKFFKMQQVPFISWDSLKLNQPCPNAVVSDEQVTDARTLCTTQGFMTCGTEMLINDTHVIFRNSLQTQEIEDINHPNVVVGSYKKHIVPWDCTYPLNYLVSLSSANLERNFYYLPVTSQIREITVNLGESGTGYGTFHVGMFLYSNSEYVTALTSPANYNMNDTLYVGIRLLDGPLDTVVEVRRCWGTPSENRDDERTFFLIEDFCPQLDFVKIHNTNSVSHHFHWSSYVFRFENSTYVYLHCEVHICFYQFQHCYKHLACSGSSQRKKRSSDFVENNQVLTIGPFSVLEEVPAVRQHTEEIKTNTSENENDVIWTIMFGAIVMTSSITLFVLLYFMLRRRMCTRQRHE